MGCCCIKNPNQLDDSQEDLLSVNNKTSAEKLKEQGNKNFKQRLYENAIKCYQGALVRNPKEIVYYTNLALAYKQNKQYKESVQTINRLLKISGLMLRPDNQILLKKGKITKCRSTILLAKQYILKQKYSNQQTQKIIHMLQEAITLLTQVKRTQQFQNQADQYLKNAYKIKKYIANLSKNTSQQQQLRNYLNKKLKSSYQHDGNVNENIKKNLEKLTNLSSYYSNSAQILQQLERLIQLQRKNWLQENQEQQYILDPITYEIFQNPVIAPSGLTYDQQILRQHFSKNGHKDPITKQAYKPGQKILVRNKNLQKYICRTNQQNIRKQQIQLMVC